MVIWDTSKREKRQSFSHRILVSAGFVGFVVSKMYYIESNQFGNKFSDDEIRNFPLVWKTCTAEGVELWKTILIINQESSSTSAFKYRKHPLKIWKAEEQMAYTIIGSSNPEVLKYNYVKFLNSSHFRKHLLLSFMLTFFFLCCV